MSGEIETNIVYKCEITLKFGGIQEVPLQFLFIKGNFLNICIDDRYNLFYITCYFIRKVLLCVMCKIPNGVEEVLVCLISFIHKGFYILVKPFIPPL